MTMENIYLIASLCAVMIKIIKPVKKYYLQVVDSYINYIKKNKENRERKFYSIKEKLYTNLRILKVFNYLKNDEILKNLKLIEKSRNIIKERMYSKNKEEINERINKAKIKIENRKFKLIKREIVLYLRNTINLINKKKHI
jgi:hypothetical protein